VGYRRGFSLVEMLTVVAIIVTLAATVFPVYEASYKRAERSSCLWNLRQCATAVSLYAEDYDGWCVPARISYPAGTWGTTWDVLLQPYLRSSRTVICPSDILPTQVPSSVSLKHSYGINYEVALIGGYNGCSLQLYNMEQPENTILFFDLCSSNRTMGGTPRTGDLKFLEKRHQGHVSIAFAAGNAKSMLPQDTLKATSIMQDKNYWQP